MVGKLSKKIKKLESDTSSAVKEGKLLRIISQIHIITYLFCNVYANFPHSIQGSRLGLSEASQS